MHRRAADGDHELPELRQSRSARGLLPAPRSGRRHGRGLHGARHAGHRRQRLALQRESDRRRLSDAGHRHGRARRLDSTHVTRATFQHAGRRDRAARRDTRRDRRQRVSRAHSRRGRRRAAALRPRRASARSSTRCSSAIAAGAVARRTTAATAGSPSRSPSACIDESRRTDWAPTSISRAWRDAAAPRAALRRGAGTRIVVHAAIPTRCSRSPQRTACRRDGSARSTTPARRLHDRASDDATRSADVDALADAYHDAIPRIMSRAPLSRAGRRDARSRLGRSDVMCGIFGVHGHPDAAALVAPRAVLAAAPRAGVGRHRRGRRRRQRARRPKHGARLRRIRRAHELDALHGDVAIGHTRYSTAGSSTIENAQPVLARFRGGHIALAHNGNLTNATSCGASSRTQGSIFASTMDSEVHRASHRAIARPTTPEERLADALQRRRRRVLASSSSIGDTLLAARDPRGWRPLVMGKLGDAYVFASETLRARHRRRDVRCAKSSRGEIVAVDADGVRSIVPASRRRSRAAACSSTCTSRGPTAASSAARSTARAARSGGASRRSARRPARSSCSACPTPRTPRRSDSPRSRGLPFELALIRNHYVGRTFIQPTQAGRDAKVKVKYNAVREVLEGKSVVMVDDSIVRGTTTRGLVAHGARRRRARSAHARQLGADHRPVLLRHRHAEPRGAHRREP